MRKRILIELVHLPTAVATVGGTDHRPTGVGDVSITWTDDSGKAYDITLKDALYFPDSPVKVVSVTSLADHFNDDEGTYIITKRRHSEFVWDHSQFKKTFEHPSSRLPEMIFNEGNDTFKSFYTFIEKAMSFKRDASFVTNTSELPDKFDMINEPTMITDDEYSDSESSDDESSINESICLQPSPSSSQSYELGEEVRYSKDGYTEKGNVIEIDLNEETFTPTYKLKFDDGREELTTREFIQPGSDSDMMDIPVSQEDYMTQARCLTADELETLMNPSKNDKLLNEFMAWHERLHHLSFSEMFKLCEHGYLPAKFKKLKHKKFLCPSCIFGKQRRRPWRTKKKGSSIRNKDDTKPGKTVSVDQLISAHPGLVPRFDGKHDRSRITAVTVFFDHFTNFSYCHLMRSTDTEETLAAKLAFEKVAQSYGVNIERYHADNGRFAEKSFKAAVEDASQKISFCGVDAHHQAGIIERHIQELTKNARTLLLHAKRNWPDAIGTILWPFAIKAAERRHNLFRLDDKGNTPLSRFADTQVMTPMEDSHTWGCPVYILEAKAAQGKMPKWEPRSRLEIYLGNSPCHAGSVALVLNPKTLNISPQYHVVFDDHFSTIPYLQKGSVPPHWEELVTKCSEHATDQDFDQAFQMAQEESTDDSEISTETIVSEGEQSIISEG
jgi:hypothetical protein